jgi:hypothetical protein
MSGAHFWTDSHEVDVLAAGGIGMKIVSTDWFPSAPAIFRYSNSLIFFSAIVNGVEESAENGRDPDLPMTARDELKG